MPYRYTIDVVTPPTPQSNDLSYVYLLLEGAGVAWFDLLTFTYNGASGNEGG